MSDILNCYICNHLFDWNKYEYCPICNWQVIDYIGDMEHTAVLLRPEREAWIAKKKYNVTDFSYTGYIPALVEAMKNQFTLEDFDENYKLDPFYREWHENNESFNERLSNKPVLLGKAKLFAKLYNPNTGDFPLQIQWDQRISLENQTEQKYCITVPQSDAKKVFDSAKFPPIYLSLNYDELKQIHAIKGFLIANHTIFELSPLESIQILEIKPDDEEIIEHDFDDDITLNSNTNLKSITKNTNYKSIAPRKNLLLEFPKMLYAREAYTLNLDLNNLMPVDSIATSINLLQQGQQQNQVLQQKQQSQPIIQKNSHNYVRIELDFTPNQNLLLLTCFSQSNINFYLYNMSECIFLSYLTEELKIWFMEHQLNIQRRQVIDFYDTTEIMSPLGNYFLSKECQGYLKLTNVNQKHFININYPNIKDIQSLRFNNDQSYLAGLFSNNDLTIWELEER